MAGEATTYATSCEECQKCKPDLRGRQGLPLSIKTPERAGEVICMDFVGPFRTKDGYTSILVVIDKLTRYVVYIPLKDIADAPTVFGALERFWLAHFGPPKAIVSDRDSRFTSRFWEDLWAEFRVELKRSTAFHPQTDGSTERANRTMIDALRAQVNGQRNDWDTLLPAIQSAHNSAICDSTKYSPDFLMFGREIRSGLDAELEQDGVEPRVSHPGARKTSRSGARRPSCRRARTSRRRRSDSAQLPQGADARRTSSWATSSGSRARTCATRVGAGRAPGARKLDPLFYGPYEGLGMHGSNAARLKLPGGCRLYEVFNLDLLRKFVDGREAYPDHHPARHLQPGPVPEEDPLANGPGDPISEVEAILARRGKPARREYFVLWKGWARDRATWEPEANLTNCDEAIQKFLETERRRSPR